MLKRKKQINKFKKKNFIFIGFLLILSGLCLVCTKYGYNYMQYRREDKLIDNFYEEQKNAFIDCTSMEDDNVVNKFNYEKNVNLKSDYIAVIKISKIHLEKGICSKESLCNNLNHNIEILNESDYPDKDKGNFILAGHSGSGSIAYFKNLYKLSLGDNISIFYNGMEYRYKVKNIYDIEKTGRADIVRNMDKSTLTLITCRQGTNKQIILVSELVKKIEI